MSNFTNTDDVIDMRDVIARFEEIEESEESEEMAEKLELQALIEECKGNGGDEEWRGDWYPVTLIHESAFEDQMDEMIEECYELPKDLPFWMTISYDYKVLKMDYTSVDFAGETYLIR